MPTKAFLLLSLFLTLAAFGQEVVRADSSTKAEEVVLPIIVIARPELIPEQGAIRSSDPCSTHIDQDFHSSPMPAIKSVGDLKESMLPDSCRMEIEFEKEKATRDSDPNRR